MPDEPCGCCGIESDPKTRPEREPGANVGRWIDDRPLSNARLPSDVRAVMGRFLEDESLETVGDCVGALGSELVAGPLDPDSLCHTDESTPHWGVLDGDRFHFECFYDVLLFAELRSSPATMHTEAPDGTTILAHSSGPGEWTVTPADAAMSFGIGVGLEPLSAAEDPLEAANAAMCPHVRAFPNREAYHEWAATGSGETIGFPLDAGVALATQLASPDDR